METFQIKVSSWVIYILTLLTIIFVGTALGIVLLPTKGNPPIAIAMAVVVFGFAFYVTRFTARASTEWTISETGLQIRWIDQFIFHSAPDLNVNWSQIQEYKYRPDQNFDLFKLKLSDGSVIKLWHNTSTTNDDFHLFVDAFERKVLAYNKNDADTSTDIRKAKTFYETKLGLVLAILTGLCLLSIPILLELLPHKGKVNWAGMGIAYAGGIFFILQVIIHRRKQSI